MGGARCPVRFLDNSIKFHRRPFLGAAKLRIILETPSLLSDFLRSCCISVSLHRYLMGNALMTPTVVIILDVVSDSLSQKRHIVLWGDVDVLRLDGTPEAFYPDIVLASSTSVHTDLDAEALTGRQPQAARILAALIGVDDLRCAIGFHSHAKHLYTVLLAQRVMQPPGHDAATVDVYYRREVHEPVQHRYISNVDAPDLIGTGDGESAKQIGHLVLRRTQFGEVPLRVNRDDVHLAHQPADALRTYKETKQEQMVYHALHTLGGMLGVFPVYLLHHLKVLCRLALGLVVVRTLTDAEKLKLAVHAQLVVWGY